ncbi:MAG: hypothetical protein JRE58_13780 [Deltaproteobacteria bacterium]|nr:hypothetical protein [Deltaproteobacteria bacterium]
MSDNTENLITKEDGFRICRVEKSMAGAITADVWISTDSSWFEGHFPEDPVLPGIAQLSLILTVVEKALNLKIRIYSFNRVRFKQIIRPGDVLEIIAAPGKRNHGQYSFQVQCRGETVLTGLMNIEPI